MPQNSQISLRPGTKADIPTLVDIAMVAFGHDMIAGALFPPSREPDAAKRKEDESVWRVNRMREDLKNPQKAHIVAYMVHSKEEGGFSQAKDEDKTWRGKEHEEHIIGFAVWEAPEDAAPMTELLDDGTSSTTGDVDADKTMVELQDQQKRRPASLDTEALEMLINISDEGAKSVLGEKGASHMWSESSPNLCLNETVSSLGWLAA
jgi:hypothetical protein